VNGERLLRSITELDAGHGLHPSTPYRQP
jgi:hypothetical protein